MDLLHKMQEYGIPMARIFSYRNRTFNKGKNGSEKASTVAYITYCLTQILIFFQNEDQV